MRRVGRGWLYVSAGGGGDAIAAALIHRSVEPADTRPLIATFAWDRLLVDPLPGPRGAADFEGLEPLGAHTHLVRPTTRAVPPAGSLLPRLAGALDAEVLLLDPHGGAAGLRRQLAEAAERRQLGRCAVVDVGGDILAHGDEPGLRSPLADGLALAAASPWPDSAALVTGAGFDGELSPGEVGARCAALQARPHPPVTPQAAARLRPVLTWHTSEASGLLCLAALGFTGTAEVRARGDPVALSPESAAVRAVSAGRALAHNRVADAVRPTTSLADAEAAVAALGRESEIALERRRRRRPPAPAAAPTAGDGDPGGGANPARGAGGALTRLEVIAADARARGVRLLTMRRIAERLGLTHEGLAALQHRLEAEAHPAYLGPALDTARVAPAAAWPHTAGANRP